MLYIKTMRLDGDADASSALVQRTCQDLFWRKGLSEALYVGFVPSWVSSFFSFFFALSCILSWRVFTAGSLGRRTWCATSLGKLSQGRRRNLQSFPHVVPDTTTQRVFFLSSFNSLPANNREQIKGGKRNPESYKHWTVCAFCCAGGLYRSRNSVCAACCLGLKKKKKDYASQRLLGRRGQELKVKRCCCCIVDSLLLSSFFFSLLKAHFWLVLTALWWF